MVQFFEVWLGFVQHGFYFLLNLILFDAFFVDCFVEGFLLFLLFFVYFVVDEVE